MAHSYGNIPALLKQRPNWVVWGVPGAEPKAPFEPRCLLANRQIAAKAGRAETWGRYHQASECVRRGLALGIGYQFDGSGIYGVDLDHVIDSAGALTPQAREVVDGLASYTEASPSGSGLHIFVLAPGADITRHRKKDGFVEIYGDKRYFTVTGNIYGGMRGIEERTAALQSIHDRYFQPAAVRREDGPALLVPVQTAEQERFLRAGLERDPVFRALWAGERRYGNESSDDQALMNKLAYWCSADPGAMIQAFIRSPHHAQKDDAHKAKCQRADYLPITAQKACANVYSTAAADHERWKQGRQREKSQAR